MKGSATEGQVVIYPISPKCYYEIPPANAAALSWGSYPWQQALGLKYNDHENNVSLTLNMVKHRDAVKLITLA